VADAALPEFTRLAALQDQNGLASFVYRAPNGSGLMVFVQRLDPAAAEATLAALGGDRQTSPEGLTTSVLRQGESTQVVRVHAQGLMVNVTAQRQPPFQGTEYLDLFADQATVPSPGPAAEPAGGTPLSTPETLALTSALGSALGASDAAELHLR